MVIERILRKYGYPPDKQEKATQTVLEQIELLGWGVAAQQPVQKMQQFQMRGNMHEMHSAVSIEAIVQA